MKFKQNAVAGIVAAMLAIAPNAMSASGNRVGGYDFGYATNGDSRVLPVQIFDNGKDTYFQFRAGDPIPAIFQVKGKEVKLMVPTFEGPYVKVAETAGRYTLQLGRTQGQVVYASGARDENLRVDAYGSNGQRLSPSAAARETNVKLVASLENSMQYLTATQLEANSYATPVRGDRIEWRDSEVSVENEQIWFPKGQAFLTKKGLSDVASMGARFRNATAITIIGRDDSSYKEGLEIARGNAIKESLIRAGVPSNVITVRPGVAGKEEKGLWASDIRVAMTAPTRIARPGNESANNVRANIQQLLTAGVLTADQAAAFLRRVGIQEAQNKVEQEASIAAATAATSAPAHTAAPVEPVKRIVEMPEGGFQFRASDRTVSATMLRWATETNHQLLWEAPAMYDAPITGNATMQAESMKDAVEKVLSSMQRKGYPIQATIYSNRVIRVTASK